MRIQPILGACMLAGCSDVFMPEGAVPFTPPGSYLAVWDSAQSCTGRSGKFSDIRWFVVEGSTFDTPEDEGIAGRYEDGVITLASEYMYHPMVVKHEMIHALGVSGHPTVPFDNPCHALSGSYDGTRLEP